LTRTNLLLAAGLLTWSAFAQGVKPDFSGTWKLNNGKSTQDGAADRVYTEAIQQSGKAITVATKSEGVTNALDGAYKISVKPTVVHVSKGLYRFTKVSWEGATLIFEITDKDSTKELAKVLKYVRESWTLSPDGRVLTKFRRAADPGKPIADTKYVFDKQ
jgi:hypothetical protein